jgi:GNAT superfamily N-acetyltransferase
MADRTALERCLAFLDAQKRLVADRAEAVDGGTALLTESLPRVWDLNLLVADPGADVGARRLADEADRVYGPAGLGFRKVVMRDEAAGEELAAGFAALGWTVESSAVMVHSGSTPGPGGARADEVPAETAAAVMEAFRRERPFGRDESVLAELAEADARYTELLGARDFAAPAGGPYGANCRLYSLGRTAEIDEVGALTEHRGRGLGGAAVRAALEAAGAGGHDTVFLLADRDDWPREWYGRLGFEELGAVFEFLQFPAGQARAAT